MALGFFAVGQFAVKNGEKKPNLTETKHFFTANCPTAKNLRTARKP